MKYKVAVCDDNKDQLKEILGLAGGALGANKIDHVVTSFLSGDELIAAVRAMPGAFDIILLDILLNGDNGVDVARKLRTAGYGGAIVFITVSPDFAIDGYEVGAHRYLLKPPKEEELAAIFLADYEKLKEKSEVVFRIGTEIRKVPVSDICSISSKKRGVIVRTKTETFDVPVKITEIESMLPSGPLVRCHRSHIINVEHIDHIRRYEACIRIAQEIPVSKAYFSKVKDKMLDYLSK